MKTRTGILTLIFLCVFWLTVAGLAMTASAQTPDGETPAEEGICDFLQSGYSKGLYGLCVAYCEAHDADLLSVSGDPTELNVPNVRILENYRRKMQEGDPDMPCVRTTECPCFNQADLDLLDAPTQPDFYSPNACQNRTISGSTYTFRSTLIEDVHGTKVPRRIDSFNIFQVYAYDYTSGLQIKRCYHATLNYKRLNSHVHMEVSDDEYEACRQLVINHGKNNSAPGEYWDCWDE